VSDIIIRLQLRLIAADVAVVGVLSRARSSSLSSSSPSSLFAVAVKLVSIYILDELLTFIFYVVCI
jgi:hypothetical protein